MSKSFTLKLDYDTCINPKIGTTKLFKTLFDSLKQNCFPIKIS